VALPPPASPPRPAPSAAIAHTHDGAIAPNGTWFALVVRESLVLQDRAGGALRTLVEHGVQGPIAWSPDSRRLLVGMVPSVTASVETVLVDVDGGPPRKLAVPGYAGFLSDREAVVALPRERSIAIVPLDGDAALPRRCDVPGDYTFLWDPRGLPDGTIVVRAQSVADRSSRLAFLDCRGHAPVFAHEAIDGYALTDTGTVVALVKHDAGDEIVEITSAAKVLSRRPTPSPLEAVLGRRRGVDHVLTRAQRTQLVRVDDGVSQLLQTFDHDMSIYPSPDGNQIAWLRHDRRPQPPGELRISAHDDLAQSRTVLDNALTAGWAPSGRLAALVEDRAPSGAGAERWLVVLDASFHPTRRIAVGDIDPEAAPVWLDEHRIAVRTGDRTRYRWYALDGEAQGEIGDGDHGSTLWLTASPRSGVRAMWRMGPPGAIDEHTEHLWLQTPDGELRPLHVADAVRHYLVPSWSRSGELLVRSLQTGVVSRVDLETGELTLIARLPPTPLNEVFDDHLVVIPYGDVLAVNHLIEVQIATVREDAPSRRSSPRR
ncbi:MAG TPA: hypothetical protein VIX73_29830, partial [Kofleriaceae bacterium]|jgi:hypothetical protein